MILSNELDDIYYCFVLIRADIRADCNVLVLEGIIKAILEKPDGNNVRSQISKIEKLDLTKWVFAFHHHYYTYKTFIKDEGTIKYLSCLCAFLKHLLELKKYEEAYDFVDSIHNLPIIAKRRGVLTKLNIKRTTKEYRRKWKTNLGSFLELG